MKICAAFNQSCIPVSLVRAGRALIYICVNVANRTAREEVLGCNINLIEEELKLCDIPESLACNFEVRIVGLYQASGRTISIVQNGVELGNP